MKEFNVSMDSSSDELMNSIFNLLEKSQDTVNVVYSSAYNNNFDGHFFERQVIYLTRTL